MPQLRKTHPRPPKRGWDAIADEAGYWVGDPAGAQQKLTSTETISLGGWERDKHRFRAVSDALWHPARRFV